MATLKVLEVPIKTGSTITNGRLELGTVIKHLTLPVLDGGTITDVTYDLPSGSDANIIVGISTDSPSLFNGKVIYCYDSNNTLIDQQTITNGRARFNIDTAGTYTFTVTY